MLDSNKIIFSCDLNSVPKVGREINRANEIFVVIQTHVNIHNNFCMVEAIEKRSLPVSFLSFLHEQKANRDSDLMESL